MQAHCRGSPYSCRLSNCLCIPLKTKALIVAWIGGGLGQVLTSAVVSSPICPDCRVPGKVNLREAANLAQVCSLEFHLLRLVLLKPKLRRIFGSRRLGHS